MSRNFDGTGDWVSLNSAPVTASPLTISCWFRLQTTGADVVLVTMGTTGSNLSYFLLYKGSAGDVKARVDNGTTAAEAASTATVTETSNWHHACAVFTNTTSRAAYLDGTNKGTNATSLSHPTPNAGRLGAFPDDTFLYTGMMQQVCVWNVALGDSDVSSLNSGVSPLLIQPANLKCYMPYLGREGAGNDVSLVNGITGTPSGTSFNASEPSIPIGNPLPMYHRLIMPRALVR